MKTLGLIGGTSWHATVEYYSQINQKVGEVIGKQANPELIIYSINIELMREQNKEKIQKKYLEVCKKLQEAGADGIIICANTPHMIYDYVQPKIDAPILHIGIATGRAAQDADLKTLGLLGNKPTMKGKFISSVLENDFGMKVIIPEGDDLDQSHHYVSKELTQGIFSEQAKAFYLDQIKELKRKGADGIILGCTELPILLKGIKADLPLLATTDLHIEMAVNFILENNL
ncbi:racemase [Marivirga tractuosa]|uniref:Aspartate racemase n=1 Tax=Marivirga tractuosa (strain ATCC 23168 / DSM 4126 / NBRC 15989 / NCIMB 1408 / VKM B-1430 / H-43) TaxID=643867 RepID=E4TMQ8_MARTH|nr:amino acid racemase [Marivirga tractuosa]ADR20356.1 aspartate racemase [Marivirga tractuosa DSM 4126]BDD15201.1 racemase [Marivirga tractuosa]